MKNRVALLVENHSWVMAKITRLISSKNYNIDSIAVGVTLDPAISRVNLIFSCSKSEFIQIKRQLAKILYVKEIIDLTEKDRIEREIFILKIKKDENINDLVKIINEYNGKIIELGKFYLLIEFHVNDTIIKKILAECQNFEIADMIRSGEVFVAKLN